MSETKNFGIAGVGPTVQLGKAGPNLVANSTVVELRDAQANNLVVARAAPAIGNSDVVVLSQLSNAVTSMTNAITNAVSNQDGFHVALGNAVQNQGSAFTSGAISLTQALPVSTAIEELNNVLGKLVPTAPGSFPNGGSLTASTVGSNPVLASGVSDYATSGLTAGSSVSRTTGVFTSTTGFSSFNAGDGGTLSLLIDGAVVGSHTMAGNAITASDNGTYGGLVIAGEGWYPAATPGFWTAANASVTSVAIANVGVHSAKVTDSAAGSSNLVYFVKDSLTAAPAVSGATVAQNAAGTLAYSSSVPHYNTGASLTVGGSISNLAGQTYYNGNPLVISSTNGHILGSQSFSYSNVGISTPIPQNTTSAVALTPVTVNVNGTGYHGSDTIKLTATNVNNTGSQTPATIILLKNGTALSTQVDEMSIPVSSLGSSPNNNNATRVTLTGNSDTPSSLTNSAWSETAALQTYDAAVVGGILSCNQTNYASGAYLPAGPNLSTQAGTQYVTFSFNRSALSNFIINVTGSYAGCWIGMPGVSDNNTTSPNAKGGCWWNMFAAYSGAGVPGRLGDTTAGCASGSVMSGGSGAFTATFGTASSTSATSNQILVRFKLTAGQSITALSFT